MSFAILFVLVPIGAIVAWWLSQQRLMAKPWLEIGAIDEVPDTGASSLPAAMIGLGVFLAVVSSLFALLSRSRARPRLERASASLPKMWANSARPTSTVLTESCMEK